MNTKPADLVFVGIKGSVVALDRSSGEQVWAAHLKGSDFVNVVVQNGVILASCHGEVYCLDPLTGNGLWHNPLKGFGVGLATIATEGNVESGNAALMAEKRGRDQAAVVAASVAVVAASG
jgi:outer membrane protein assembly factor BamB